METIIPPCTCRGGWGTYSGHRLDCPANEYAGRIRFRIDRGDREDRDMAADRTVRLDGRRYDIDDVPSASEL